MDIQKQIGDNLRNIREEKGMTQTEVAKNAKINTNYYAKVERGVANASTEMLQKLASALGVKVKDLVNF